MTSDHDKLLAEGPRTAAEPVTADGVAAPDAMEPALIEPPLEQPGTTVQPTASKPPLLKDGPRGPWQSPGSGSWLTGRLLRRLLPLLLVFVVLGRGFAGSHSGSWTIALIWAVAAVLILVLRARGRRPW